MSKEIVYRTREEVLNLWVNALRSGKYRKCRYYLHKGSCFCALGVLVDLAVKDGGPKWRHVVDKIYVTGYGSSVSVPEEFTKFLNISFQNFNAISKMNDDGMSFKKIADYIENTYIKKKG